MKKLNNVGTISIKFENGEKTVRINGSKIINYDINGASFLANEIEALEPNSLGCFNPILVEFDETFINTTGCKHLETLVASFQIVDDNLLETFVTFMDPHSIEGNEMHEAFQLSLEQIVAEEKSLELYAPVRQTLSPGTRKKLQKMKDESKDQVPGFDFSEVGYVQFTVLISADTFAEAFLVLNKISAKLKKKAMKNMKMFLSLSK